jgi:uncharacterized protein (TIGR00369 family)
MTNEVHYQRLEKIYHTNPCNQYYKPFITVREGEAEVMIPIRPEFLHAGGVVHGSVYFKALDDAATFAVSSLVDDVAILTASFNIYFTRPVSNGLIKAVGRVVHQSRRLLVADAEAYDEHGRQVARGSGTFMRSQVPLPDTTADG